MSKTGRESYRSNNFKTPERYIYVDAERRDPPDFRKLSRAVIAIALREAEMEAEALAVLKYARNDHEEQSVQTKPNNDGAEAGE